MVTGRIMGTPEGPPFVSRLFANVPSESGVPLEICRNGENRKTWVNC
jgi:hypothetical protein